MSADQGRGPRRGSGGDGRRRGDERASSSHRPRSGGQSRRRRTDGDPRRARHGGDRRRARPDSRSVALAVLTAVRERDAYANLTLPAELRRAGLDARDAALATELTYGTLRAQGLLDRIVEKAASRPATEIDPPVLDIVRLGAYQLLFTRIGAHAAVDTSVEAARAAGLGRAGAFVNAVLRTVSARGLEEWVEDLRTGVTDPVARLAVGTAHPEWIARAFAESLGPAAAELPAMLAADDARPQVHLAARPGAISAEELALVTGGTQGRYSPYAVYLESGDPGSLDAVTDRLAAVQDEGSQLVALAAARAPLDGADGGRWLDLCAGPGGKAVMLGALAEIEGASLTGVEVSDHRADLVREATRDLPVEVHTADGRATGLEPGFDRVLLDAPCSGLGALRRRPEARWRKQAGDIAGLVALQRELLASALGLVRTGGVVLYATCSPHLSETVSVVREAVRRGDVELLDLRRTLPEVTDAGEGPWLQLWPHRHGTDAMFMAALRPAS
ncbi:RsmB/NOP family class I SAM-dependent RNA methyltransferase [Dietzia sp. 179-F 9C3 NHS]|uniref:RsmB/NOP family class I SAM-dependent RNA methyltransferase n=1 Tax=Dietzia sp. 179-F 9C3 NHS TaxID=3374295 RepID=UPI00387902A2